MLLGQILLAIRLSGPLRWSLAVAVAGVVLAVVTEADPWHDLGLFVFEGAWIALGITLLRGRERLP